MPRGQRTPPKELATGNIVHTQSEPDMLGILSDTPEPASKVFVRPRRPRNDSSPEIDSQQSKKPKKDEQPRSESSSMAHSYHVKEYELLDTIRNEIRAVLSTEISATIKACLAEETSELKKVFGDLKKSVDFMSDEFDRIKSDLDSYKVCNATLVKENESLKKTVLDLSVRVNLIEQNSRQQNVEINGIPENTAENLIKTVYQLSKSVSCDIKEEEVLSAVRVRKLDPENRNPRAVIVNLRSTHSRDVILTSVMNFNRANPSKKLNSNHLGYGGPAKPIFVSEHLSPLNKQIHAATRKAARDKGYKYVWVRDGRILIRKADGEQAKQIRSLEAVALL